MAANGATVSPGRILLLLALLLAGFFCGWFLARSTVEEEIARREDWVAGLPAYLGKLALMEEDPAPIRALAVLARQGHHQGLALAAEAELDQLRRRYGGRMNRRERPWLTAVLAELAGEATPTPPVTPSPPPTPTATATP